MDKLKSLRKKMEDKGIDGFIMPMSDRFHNEFVPPYARRLEWLTGFTGSSGSAVILKDKAAFFTDGRYTLQAKEQVDQKLFDHFNIMETSSFKWVKENLSSGQKLGFDPWLQSKNSFAYYEDADCELVPVENMIDDIWDDKPKKQTNGMFIHSLNYAGKKYEDKIKDIANEVKKNKADAFIIAAPESVCWLLNIRGDHLPNTPFVFSYAVIDKDCKVDLYLEEPNLSGEIKDYFADKVSVFAIDDLENNLKSLAEKKVIIDPIRSSYAFFELLGNIDAKIIEKIDLCLLPKACKNEVEVEGMKNAHIRDGASLTNFLYWLENNIGDDSLSEISVAEKLEEFRSGNDLFKGLSFPTISGYGSNGAIVHYHADEKSNKRIKEGSLYLVDSGAQYLDGTTDVTRTVAIGEPTDKQKEHFTLVLKGHIDLAKSIFPKGLTGSNLDTVARRPLWQNGLDYDHGTGHGVGSFLSVHEGPQVITKRPNTVALEAGMIISNEPGYYLEGEYGIRIENLVVVKPYNEKFYCFETLTLAPIDLSLVNKDMLEDEQISWLNDYHKKVRETLYPLVLEETKSWLEKATRAI